FFSSRRRHTISYGDWSSDVCSSDLVAAFSRQKAPAFRLLDDLRTQAAAASSAPILAMDRRENLDLRRPIVWMGEALPQFADRLRSEERRVGKECRCGWSSDE